MGCIFSREAHAPASLGPIELAKPRVVIIGASFGGLSCAKALADLQTAEVADVILVEAGDSFSAGACWQYVIFGNERMENTLWPLSELQLPKVDVRLNTTVQAINLGAKTLTLSSGGKTEPLSYNYLVMATGSVSNRDAIPGLADRTVELTDPTQGEIIKERVNSITSGTISVVVCAVPYKCPPVPFEYAFLIDNALRERGVRDDVKIQVIVPVPFPFGGPPMAQAFKGVMKEKGIEYVPEFKVVEFQDGGAQTVIIGEDGTQHVSDFVIAVAPQIGSQLSRDTGLTNPKGFVGVDLTTNLVNGQEDVYCIGDNSMCMLPVANSPHPRAGEFAAQMGSGVGRMLDQRVRGVDVVPHQTRNAKCYAESGAGEGITINVNLDGCMNNSAPKMQAEPHNPTGSKDKVDWLNGHLRNFFGDSARPFSPPL